MVSIEIFLIMAFIGIGFPIWFTVIFNRKIRKEAEWACSSFKELLNAEKWKIEISPESERPTCFIKGMFEGRNVITRYERGFHSSALVLNSIPTFIPHKIPWYIFKRYPKFYKDYSFNAKEVSVRIDLKKGGQINLEQAKEYLSDLIRATEAIENGNYKV